MPANNVIDFEARKQLVTKCPPARARTWDEYPESDFTCILIVDHDETRDFIKSALNYGN